MEQVQITGIGDILSLKTNAQCPRELTKKITNLATNILNNGVEAAINGLPIENDESISRYNSLLISQVQMEYSALINTLANIATHEFYGDKVLTEPPEDPTLIENVETE